MNAITAAVLQVAGLVAVVAGVWSLSQPAGVVAAGVALFLVGLAVERGDGPGEV